MCQAVCQNIDWDCNHICSIGPWKEASSTEIGPLMDPRNPLIIQDSLCLLVRFCQENQGSPEFFFYSKRLDNGF